MTHVVQWMVMGLAVLTCFGLSSGLMLRVRPKWTLPLTRRKVVPSKPVKELNKRPKVLAM